MNDLLCLNNQDGMKTMGDIYESVIENRESSS